MNSSIRNIFLIWLGWALVISASQHWVGMRLDVQRPDHVLTWTAQETTPNSQNDKAYLIDPFMNQHVSWDSEFYLSIASVGYNDPAVRGLPTDFAWGTLDQQFCRPGVDSDCYSMSYAFFPFYSMAVRAFAVPFRVFDMTPIARLTLAAVVVSMLGTLGAMLALYFMTRGPLGEEGGLRAAFYLLIFPSSFILAQVYTEGLYIGLTFGCLASLLDRKWGWSALLAALAVWTRPGIAILILPMVIVWIKDKQWSKGWKPALTTGLAALSPALSFGFWLLTPLADGFFKVEKLFFGRGLLALEQSLWGWKAAWAAFSASSPPTTFYYGLEFGAIALAIFTSLLLWREQPALSAFGLAMAAFALTSGSAQGMVRYMLVVPAMFWVPSQWGRHPAFDRIWSLLGILLLGLEAMLFSFDFWVA